MKKIIFLLFILAGTFSAFAQEEKKLVISAGQLKHLSLGNNMKVTLVNAKQVSNEVKSNLETFEKLNISVSNGTMHIENRRLSANDQVYVIVDDLQTLTIGQATTVNTEGILRSSQLKLFVTEGSMAYLRTHGKIHALSPDGYEVNIKRTTIIFSEGASPF